MSSALAVVSRPAADQDGDDLDLVAGVRAGNDRAFEALYVRYQGRITAYVRGMVHDHGRAEDITQEVFMSALRRMRETEAQIVFKPWIYEIAKNACIDAWRRSRNTNEVSFDAHDALGADDHGCLAGPGVTPHSAIDAKFAFDNLCGAFGGLSQTHHEILVMREFEGLSYREIGERLGMSRPGVESTLFRARRRLSEEYEELVSGERCRRVQQIIDSPGGRGAGLRDQRRLSRHISHCQPCRRYARLSGLELDTAASPAAAAAARIAAVTPLPLFLRRRGGGEEDDEVASHLVAQPHPGGSVSHWASAVASTLDPGTVSGWSKAIATAATVAVAGVGAGTAIKEHAVDGLHGAAPPVAGQAAAHGSVGAGQPSRTVRRGARSAGARASAPAARTGETSGDAATGDDSGDPAPVAAGDRSSAGGQAPAAGSDTAPGAADVGHDDGAAAPVAHGAPPPRVTGDGAAVPTPPQQAVSHALDTLGAGSGAPGAEVPPAVAGATAQVDAVVGSARDAVAGLKVPPVAPATTSAAEAGSPPATGLAATVPAAVTTTLDRTIAGRAAP
jgi:RNA polymerase sigma factor (sigma-70 family)